MPYYCAFLRWPILLIVATAWLIEGLAFGQAPQAAPRLTADQLKRLEERDRLAKEITPLIQGGKLAEAIGVVEKKLAIERAVFGDIHADVADSLAKLGELHLNRQDFPAARKALGEAVAIIAKLHGEKHWKVAGARMALAYAEKLWQLTPEQRQRLRQAGLRHNQAAQLFQQGKYKEGIEPARQALEIRQQVMGEKDPLCTISHNALGSLYLRSGDFVHAETAFRQALEIRRPIVGEEHPLVAESLHNLALVYLEGGAYAKALPLLRQAADIRRQTLGERSLDYAESLAVQAKAHTNLGAAAQAVQLYEQAVAIRRQIQGEKHPAYARTLGALAAAYRVMGAHEKAQAAFQKTLEIQRQVLGEKHPEYAFTLSGLALLYLETRAYTRAEPLYHDALAIYEQLAQTNRVDYAHCLSGLAVLYQNTGDYTRARPLYEKALDIYKKTLGERHPDTARCLTNLGGMYQACGALDKAEPLFLQAVQINEQLAAGQTEKSFDYAFSLGCLADLYARNGSYAKAEPLYQTVTKIYHQLFGDKHPRYAMQLDKVGGLHSRTGNHATAEALHRQALAIYQEIYGENHPDCSTSLNCLAEMYLIQGEPRQAEKCLRQSLAIGRIAADEFLSNQGERAQLRFIFHQRNVLDAYLSIGPDAKAPAGDLYREVLVWKGAVTAMQAQDRLAREQPALQPLIQQLTDARTRLARIAFSPPKAEDRKDWLRRINEARAEKEQLEARLARESAEFRKEQERKRLEPVALAGLLPADTAFVDVLDYVHFLGPEQKKGPLQKQRRLVAFVLRPKREPILVPLGSTSELDDVVTSWRKSLQGGDAASLQAASAKAAERVWKPLETHLAGVTTLFVAADGPCCRMPLAALPGKRSNSYLIEDLAIAHVISGHHLAESLADGPKYATRGLLAVGGIDYSAPLVAANPKRPSVSRESPPRTKFPNLPGTEWEARRLATAFEQTFPKEPRSLLTGTEPDERRLKEELSRSSDSRWCYIHLAGHGFFAPPTVLAAGQSDSRERPAVGLLNLESPDEERAFALNPLLLSGLVLAGANQTDAGGILTAEQVLAFDLRGTELLVLSACDTALGRGAGGEILGLQRAFHLAGARTVVTSLWRVDDAATAVLMDEFYAQLWQKKLPKLEALRQAQLTVLAHPERVTQRRKELEQELVSRGLKLDKSAELPDKGRIHERSHPGLWAGFLLSGASR
jgi:CHAT domain-containing protein/Flp pilus assembly protein TadD